MQAIAGRDRDAGIAGLSKTDLGCPSDRDQALAPGVDTFLAPQTGTLEDAGEVDVRLDVIGGDILGRSAALVPTRRARPRQTHPRQDDHPR